MTLYVRPLSEQERGQLDALIAQARPEALVTRAQIVLLSSQGYKSTEISPLVGRHPASVRKWICRFNDQGISGLTGAPSPGRKPSLTDEQVQQMVDIALTKPGVLGQPYNRWSLHRLVRHLVDTGVVRAISHDTVWRTLRAKGIFFEKGKGWVRNERG